MILEWSANRVTSAVATLAHTSSHPLARAVVDYNGARMQLASGTKLGPYEILAPLGAGGMGEVYRARDTRLGRDVAVKALPAHLSSDSEARTRFEREAKTVSALNHPNICTLYDVGHQDGIDFIVMEYLEGETLEKRLEKGPLPLGETLKYGAQIADGLDKAHRIGVVHRDLKPGNIMLTKSGAKLLDFGLAKPSSAPATLATMTMPSSPLTQQGMVVGTFQYMSPEQVEAHEVDARSDIFSLGTVLYEMLTGRKAFEGKSQLSVASAILEKEPEPVSTIAPLTPLSLDHAIRRCLAKNRDERWQTALDLGSEMKWIRESDSKSAASVPPLGARSRQTWRLWLPWALAVLAAGLVAIAMLWHTARNPEQTAYYSAALPFSVVDMAMAPNGHTLAVVGTAEGDRTNILWVYELGAPQARRLPGTEDAAFPFWSADGKSVAFFADGKLKRLDIAGGTVQVICDAPTGRGGTWNKDGVIVFTPSGGLLEGLYRVQATGGTPTRITTPDTSRGENSNRWPMFLPDGKHFLYFAGNVAGQHDPDAIFVGALDSNEKRFLTKATGNPAYVPSGYLLFYRQNTLFAQRFDANKFQISGDAVPLLTDVAYMARTAHVFYAASDGVLVSRRGPGVPASRLVWFDRKGNELGALGKPEIYANVAISPNNKMVALDKTDEGNQNTDVWTYDLERETFKRFTFDPAIDATAVFSPDSQRVLFASSREHQFSLYVKNVDGAEDEKMLALDASDKADRYPCDWSRDGKFILYKRATELWVAEMPDLKTRPFVERQGTAKNGQFSPDGKWVAYSSNESGMWEIYVTSFPEGRGRWQVSTAGGTQPRWRGDSRELFYLAADGSMMAVPVVAGTNFDAGAPVALYHASSREPVATSEQVTYDVTKDGQRFLINTQAKNIEKQAMSVMLNWAQSLSH
jgi:eukaryotic-like serine/threonine-protein kinase